MIEDATLFYSEEVEWNELTIKIPKVKDILNIGECKYLKLLEPFCTPFEYLEEIIANKEDLDKYKTFDIFHLKIKNGDANEIIYKNEDQKPMFEVLCEAISFFVGMKAYYIETYNIITFPEDNCDVIISRDNFDDFADLILKINSMVRFKIQKMPEFKSDRARDSWIKLQNGRKKSAKEHEISLLNKIITIMLGGKSFIDKNTIKQFTIVEFNSIFNWILSLDTWNRDFDKYLVGCDIKDLQIKKHWIYSLKLSS